MSASEAELQDRIAALEAHLEMLRDGVFAGGDVTARAFYLMDDATRRAALEQTEDGVTFRQFDSEGRTRVAMGVSGKDVAQLLMTDAAGVVRLGAEEWHTIERGIDPDAGGPHPHGVRQRFAPVGEAGMHRGHRTKSRPPPTPGTENLAAVPIGKASRCCSFPATGTGS